MHQIAENQQQGEGQKLTGFDELRMPKNHHKGDEGIKKQPGEPQSRRRGGA